MTSVELIDNYFLDYENIIDTVSNKLYTDISAQSGREYSAVVIISLRPEQSRENQR